MIALLWGFLLACGGTGDDTDTDAPAPATDDDPDVPLQDSALSLLGYTGEATVAGASWSGTEQTTIVRVLTGRVMCDWSYETVGTVWDAAMPCTDADGTPCAFAFDVSLKGGGLVEGDCTAFAGLGETAGPFGYGWTEDYQSGGLSYGPALLFYYAYDAAWRVVTAPGDAQYAGDVLTYDWKFDELAYFP